jgi:putative flavoprotein involved in K+ transport
VLGKSVHWYGNHLGLIAASLDSLRGRTQRGDTLIGTSLRALKRHHGVELVDRATDAHERTVTLKDGRELELETVIWATGYRPDYSWIHAPVLDKQGKPIFRRGVTQSPGLYFLGMKNQYSRGSSLIHWVRHDAEFIVEQLRDTSATRIDGGRR